MPAHAAEQPASSTYCEPDKELDQNEARSLALTNCQTIFKQYNGHPGSAEGQKACEGSFDSLKKAKSLMCKLTNEAQGVARSAQAAAAKSTGNDWNKVYQQMSAQGQASMNNLVRDAHTLGNLLKSRQVDIQKSLKLISENYSRVQMSNLKDQASNCLKASDELGKLYQRLAGWKEKIDKSQGDFQKSKDSLANQGKQFLTADVKNMKSIDPNDSTITGTAGGSGAPGEASPAGTAAHPGSAVAGTTAAATPEDAAAGHTGNQQEAGAGSGEGEGGERKTEVAKTDENSLTGTDQRFLSKSTGRLIQDGYNSYTGSGGAVEAALDTAGGELESKTAAIAKDASGDALRVASSDAGTTALLQGPHEAIAKYAANLGSEFAATRAPALWATSWAARPRAP